MSLVSAAPLFTARNSRSGYQIDQSLRLMTQIVPTLVEHPVVLETEEHGPSVFGLNVLSRDTPIVNYFLQVHRQALTE